MDQRRTDTRAQLQSVALELFAQRGYDSTSLREIAGRLGITKAAVYYHFRTKDEILASLIEDFLAQLDDLVRWGKTQPHNAATRIEALRRYSDMLSGHVMELHDVAIGNVDVDGHRIGRVVVDRRRFVWSV